MRFSAWSSGGMWGCLFGGDISAVQGKLKGRSRVADLFDRGGGSAFAAVLM